MKLFRFVLASLLALCLVLMPVVSSANAGSTTAPTPTKTLPTGFKFPPISEIAKRLASRANVVNYAVESLLGAVDWVLDPANNQIRYKPVSVAQDVSTSSMNPNDYVYPVHHTEFKVDIMYTTPVQACVHHIWNTYHNAQYVYTGYEFSHNGLLSCQFKNVIDDYESSIGWFPTLDREKDKEYTLPLDVVAEQIVKNAKAGHAELVDFVVEVANEIALLSQHGKNGVADTGIRDDYHAETNNGKTQDRCEWLKANKHRYPADRVKDTEKAWKCRHSRQSKDKK